MTSTAQVYVPWKKRSSNQKTADRRKAQANRRPNEHLLSTIDGASHWTEVGYLMPSTSGSSGREHLFRVVRVDTELDAIYGVIVERCPMPWWKWNLLRRQGLVDDDVLEEFNATTEG